MDEAAVRTKNTVFDFSGLAVAERIHHAQISSSDPGSGHPWEDVRAPISARLLQGT
ncbi:MAG: hypothetical protein M5U22_18435 [Thermoleophilia bacterium]|nr:hypothetical protein [Thermoleophilia bacterium]